MRVRAIWSVKSGSVGDTRLLPYAKMLLVPVSSRFIFVFALSQFSGPDYLGAWNRLFLDLIKALVYKGTETSQIQVGPLRVQFRTRAISYFIPSIKMPTSMLYT